VIEEDSGALTDAPRWFRSTWPVYAMATLVVVGIGGFFAYRYLQNAQSLKITSVAVLPFVNETSDVANEYLSDGLAESVSNSLSQMPGIRVMSRGSTFRYKRTDVDPTKVGSELNVEAVLSGRMTLRGDMLTVRAELVSAADNSLLWVEQFSRRLTDVDKLESDIASSISSKLRLRLGGDKKHETENADAYRTYLEGLYYWNKRTPDDLRKSIELFERAIALDPNFSRAYGVLASAWTVL
jgi:TolB-like protein